MSKLKGIHGKDDVSASFDDEQESLVVKIPYDRLDLPILRGMSAMGSIAALCASRRAFAAVCVTEGMKRFDDEDLLAYIIHGTPLMNIAPTPVSDPTPWLVGENSGDDELEGFYCEDIENTMNVNVATLKKHETVYRAFIVWAANKLDKPIHS